MSTPGTVHFWERASVGALDGGGEQLPEGLHRVEGAAVVGVDDSDAV